MALVLSLYGNTKLLRGFCKRCRRWAIVLDGLKQCCDKPVDVFVQKKRRMTPAELCRRLPPFRHRKRLLEVYDNRCAYCEQQLGAWVQYHERLLKLRLHWDHNTPWSYSQDNHYENFLPSCHVCNLWKSDRIFQTLDEVRVYVSQKWQEEHRK